MAMRVGISALIGVALSQRFNVLILIPTIILAMVSTAIIEVMRGAGVWSMALTELKAQEPRCIGFALEIWKS
jgi:hypothetical protein